MIVETTLGPVLGGPHPNDPNCIRFLGIPYAAAPYGENYMQAPQPHEKWVEPRACLTAPPTPQKRFFSDDATFKDPCIPGEEILNLSVFTPANRGSELLPVLVWIHGGGFKAGVAVNEVTDGRVFNQSGIVTVHVAYRLGVEGFGWIEGGADNRGFLDQQAALKWVQENIEAFGGDPRRVTIAGQSAGGGSVLAHLTCPSSQGLFSRAISQSGVLPPMSAAEARRRSEMVFARLGLENPNPQQLAQVADRVLEAEVATEKELFAGWNGAADFVKGRLEHEPVSDLPFTPWIDGKILTTSIEDGVKAGIGADKPLLLTVTSEEFTDILQFIHQIVNVEDPVEVLAKGGFPGGQAGAEEYLRKYPRAQTTALILGQLVTDQMFIEFAKTIQAERDRQGCETDYFRFDWCPGMDDPEVSVYQQWVRHSMDIPFAWGTADTPIGTDIVGKNYPKDLAQTLHSLWVNWVKS